MALPGRLRSGSEGIAVGRLGASPAWLSLPAAVGPLDVAAAGGPPLSPSGNSLQKHESYASASTPCWQSALSSSCFHDSSPVT